MTTDARPHRPVRAGGRGRRLAAWLHARPRLQLYLLLAAPLAWLVVVYLGSLFILLLNAFWTSDPFTGKVNPFDWSLDAFVQILNNDAYRTIAVRTIGMAVLVTLTDAVLAFPIAYYMARVASPRVRALLVVAILMPLWASYLVKVFAWRSIFLGNGLLSWVLTPFGIPGPGNDEIMNSWIVFSYLWLPYMILPIYAGLERVPNSLLEASADLGARAGTTFRRVVLPLVSRPGGRIDLHLLADAGRLHRPGPGQRREVHRQRHLRQLGARQLPGRGRLSMVPIVIMIVYLLVARRLGAFESL